MAAGDEVGHFYQMTYDCQDDSLTLRVREFHNEVHVQCFVGVSRDTKEPRDLVQGVLVQAQSSHEST